MSVGFSEDTKFIIPKAKIKKIHSFYGDSVRLTFSDGNVLVCGSEQLLWFGRWVRAKDSLDVGGVTYVERAGKTKLKDITLRGHKHVFCIALGSRIITVHNMPILSGGGSSSGSETGPRIRNAYLYFYAPYDNIIYSKRKTFKDMLNPYTDKSTSVELGGIFEEIGGIDEAIGGGNQKVGTDNK